LTFRVNVGLQMFGLRR